MQHTTMLLISHFRAKAVTTAKPDGTMAGQGRVSYHHSHMPTPSPKLKLPAFFSDFQETIQTSVESEQAKL